MASDEGHGHRWKGPASPCVQPRLKLAVNISNALSAAITFMTICKAINSHKLDFGAVDSVMCHFQGKGH